MRIEKQVMNIRQLVPPPSIIFLNNYYKMDYYFANKAKFIKMSTIDLSFMLANIN